MTAVASATAQQAIGSNRLAVAAMATTSRNNPTEKGIFLKMEKTICGESMAVSAQQAVAATAKKRKQQSTGDSMQQSFWRIPG